MKSFFDIEYFDDLRHRGKSKAAHKPILVSIGIVRDDGAELHLVSDFVFDEEMKNRCWWFYKNVWKKLDGLPRVSFFDMAAQVTTFIEGCSLLVTREGGFDRQLLESLIGPLTIPFCDIETVWRGFGNPTLPYRDKLDHHAIEDARWHQTMFNHVLAPVLRAA